MLTLQAATCGQKGPLTLPSDSLASVPVAHAQSGVQASEPAP